MSKKNIILRIIEEVHYFKHHLLQSVVINDNQQTFLLLSDEKILDINSLREYLLEKKNKFTKNEIKTLIAKIDACVGLQEKYSKLPIEDCTYEYNYEGKGRAYVFGRIKYTLVIDGQYFKSEKNNFEEKTQQFKHFSHWNVGLLILRLKQIKSLIGKGKVKIDLKFNPNIENNNDMPSTNESLFNQILNNNKLDRKKRIQNKTNKYDKLLLTEFINDYTEFAIQSLEKLNDTLTNVPVEKPILNEEAISFCILKFLFYEIRQIEQNEFEIISYQNEYFFNRFNIQNFSQTFIYTDIIEELNIILSDKYKVINSQNISSSNDINADTIAESENKKVDFDPNHFNQKAYELFLYLLDNYKKVGKIKYINMF